MGSRILVIEDEPGIADYLVRGLLEEGYTVGHAPDGLKGWKLLQAEPWDVILLDWTIPEIDGLELLTRFRQINAVTPVLFLTARDSISDRVSGLNAGAEDYLCKPFAFEELLARIGSLLRRRLVTAVSVISHGDVSVDLATQRAERAGHKIDLTARELSLLVFLIRNSGKVMVRKEIYEHVWDDTYDGVSNTLEVHVMELRRKLEAHGSRLIQTVRGQGYIYANGGTG
jgi:two-component system copper resistance phosphate regulon response regulator CusR